MKKLLALVVLTLASPAFATDPQFGAIRVEITPNIRHAFVSAQSQGADATKVSKDEWNAAHTAPAELVLSVPAGLVWPAQPAAVTEFCGASTGYRWRANLTDTTTIRLTAQVISAGAATAALRLQYTTDTTGASGWDYLDSISGPSVTINATGVTVSASVSIATAAKADVLLRLVGINGDGAGGTACYSTIKASTATLADSATTATTATSATSATSATALAADGANCAAGQFPLGVDASGAVQSCTALPTTIAGTANQITASAATGPVTLSIATNPTLPGTTTGTFSGDLTGNVTGNAATVTTNANLTGPITSVGNATTVADGELSAIAGLTSAADKFPYFTGSGTAALADLSSAERTFLTTPSSANLASVISDETGTAGLAVFSTSPTFGGTVTFGSTTTAGTATTLVKDTITGSSTASNFLSINGTFPATLSAETRAVSITITGDNDGQNQYALFGSLTQSGSGAGAVLRGQNLSTNTSNAMGVWGHATGAATMDIGVVGQAAGGTNNWGGWFSLANNSFPPTASAALGATNATAAFPIAALYDNTTLKWSVADGGFVRRVEGHAYLAADYTNATTTFSNTALSVNVESGRKYRFDASIFATNSTAADGAKLDFNGGSAAATNFIGTCVLNNAVGATLTQVAATVAALATPINIAAFTDTAVHNYRCTGGFEPSGAGTFILRAAGNSAASGTLTIKRGSWISLVDTP